MGCLRWFFFLCFSFLDCWTCFASLVTCREPHNAWCIQDIPVERWILSTLNLNRTSETCLKFRTNLVSKKTHHENLLCWFILRKSIQRSWGCFRRGSQRERSICAVVCKRRCLYKFDRGEEACKKLSAQTADLFNVERSRIIIYFSADWPFILNLSLAETGESLSIGVYVESELSQQVIHNERTSVAVGLGSDTFFQPDPTRQTRPKTQS